MSSRTYILANSDLADSVHYLRVLYNISQSPLFPIAEIPANEDMLKYIQHIKLGRTKPIRRPVAIVFLRADSAHDDVSRPGQSP